MGDDDRRRRRRTPAEDKALDYARQRRHYSDSAKAARKNRPRMKKKERRRHRRRLDHTLDRAVDTYADTDLVEFDEPVPHRGARVWWSSGLELGEWIEWRREARLMRGALNFVIGHGTRTDPDRLRAWLEQLMESRSRGTVPQARVLAEALGIAPAAPQICSWYGRHFETFEASVDALGPELRARLTVWIERQLALDEG